MGTGLAHGPGLGEHGEKSTCLSRWVKKRNGVCRLTLPHEPAPSPEVSSWNWVEKRLSLMDSELVWGRGLGLGFEPPCPPHSAKFQTMHGRLCLVRRLRIYITKISGRIRTKKVGQCEPGTFSSERKNCGGTCDFSLPVSARSLGLSRHNRGDELMSDRGELLVQDRL